MPPDACKEIAGRSRLSSSSFRRKTEQNMTDRPSVLRLASTDRHKLFLRSASSSESASVAPSPYASSSIKNSPRKKKSWVRENLRHDPDLPYRTSPRLAAMPTPRYSWDVPSHPTTCDPTLFTAADEDRHTDDLAPPGVAAERAGWGLVDCYGYGVRFFTPTSPGTRCDPIYWHDRCLETATAIPRPASASAMHSTSQRPHGAIPMATPLRTNSALNQHRPATTYLPVRDLGTTWRTPLRPCMLSPRRYLSSSPRW